VGGVDKISDRILAAINLTHSKVDVTLYEITDLEIASAIEKARSRGVAVRIVTDQGRTYSTPRFSHPAAAASSASGINGTLANSQT
jgi:phosphatidylserine/phosphatidylglycerophosphate/cardiolipin synthase-like enzyme